VVIGQGVFILWGVENCHLPLTKPVAVNTGWRYRAARDTQNFVLANKQNKTKSMLIFSTVVFVY